MRTSSSAFLALSAVALAFLACQRSTSLGSTGQHDGASNGGLVMTGWDGGASDTGVATRDASTQIAPAVTCTQDGTSYAVGDVVRLSACTTCVCQANGQLGLCTGACPPDALAPVDAVDAAALSAAELCTSSGGTVVTSACCLGASDFPDSCLTGACGCSPSGSHSISVCSCKVGCFLAGSGCVGPAGTCTVGVDQSCNEVAAASARGRCLSGGRCVCNSGASLNAATGKCR